MRLKLIIAILCLIFQISIGQIYNFRNFSVAEGLTQSEIYAICEDKRGNIWFGSLGGGIIKYDGYDFVSLREENGLLDNFIYSIFEDLHGKIWIGTEKGVCTYDGVTFESITDTIGFGQLTVRSIIQDKVGDLWFGTANKGVLRYNENGFEQIIPDSNNPETTIYCLFEDKDARIWMGTEKGVCIYSDDRLDWYTKKDGLPTNIVRSICYDKYERIWLATYGGGVSCYDSNRFTNYTVYDGLSNNTVYSVSTDNTGNLWFGTAHGASKFDGKTFRSYREPNGLASNIVVCIFTDSFQNIWFGTAGGGISRFDNERFIHFKENDKMGRWIYSLIQAPNGSMLFGSSEGGVSVYDGSNYSILKKADGFTNSRVIALHYAKDSTLWCGTLDDGAYKFKKQGFQHFSYRTKLHSNNITSITSDTSECIWFASLDSGLCVYNYKTDSFKIFNTQNGLSDNAIYTIIGDNYGAVWAGTVHSGLIKITLTNPDSFYVDIQNFTIEDGLNSNAIKSITIDSLNNVFIGTTGGGINIYNGYEFKSITKKQGLSSDNIYLLLLDRINNLWAGTEVGLVRISFQKDFSVSKIKNYDRSEGFSGIEVYRNSCTMDSKGQLWFGTVNGATKYNPLKDYFSPQPPKIHITGIRLFYERIENTRFVDSLSPWFPVPQNLVLPFKQNSLTFEFAGIYQKNPQAVRYKWKLSDIDESWSPVLQQREVTYSNLSPGNYSFQVIACNEDGIWNEEPATFYFEILTPFWKKWWFVGSGSAVVTLIVSLIVYFRFKRLKQKNRLMQEKLEMEKNIIELEQEAARLQMNPHFIFNSLNSIQGFIATNDPFQAKRYLAKFARLMRLILENAREEFIPVENEIEILENYLDLEKLSTNNKFNFNIILDESIDPETMEIPPMLIQPFVENAIIHGIKKKENQGHITVKFSAKQNLIICQITDDGIGRKKASELNIQRTSGHKSTGISVTKKRLEQFQMQTGTRTGIKITDLKNSNNEPVGTEVTLSIPYEIY